MQRIVILNPKGGSGKTTVATNLATYLATEDMHPVLLDLDPQGSSIRWISRRPKSHRVIHGIEGFRQSFSATRSWQMRLPQTCRSVVVDTPAAVDPQTLPEITRGADAILVPVMPSEIDIHTTAKCIADLLLIAKIRRSDNRIGIIANRVRANTLISKSLMRFLRSLGIPLVATLRDTQHYVRAAQDGVGIFEMPRWQVQRDVESWSGLTDWLSERRRDHDSGDKATALPQPESENCYTE